MKTTSHNAISGVWADLIVEECLRHGVNYFCVAPGSRSTPLALAVAKNKKALSCVHFDERGLAFHALGYAVATSKPAVVITTSGTAVANLFPAVIEASKKKIPLLLLTADRPPELRFTGANQTMDQVKIFGSYAKWFFDMPCPTTHMPAASVLTTIDQALFQTQSETPGPVHLNCMFREPFDDAVLIKDFNSYLRPLLPWKKSQSPFTDFATADHSKLSQQQIQSTIQCIHHAKIGVIAVGKLTTAQDRKAVVRLAEHLNWPIFADISSGLRLGQNHSHVIHHFDLLLSTQSIKKEALLDCLIQIGGRITSKSFETMLRSSKPKSHIMVLKHQLRNDPWQTVTHRIVSRAQVFSESICQNVSAKPYRVFLKRFQKSNACVIKTLENFDAQKTISEFSIVRNVSKTIPKTHGLFLSNSLPIREMDMFGSHQGNSPEVTANRGVSGIDGILATASGFTTGRNQPTTLIIGDLAFLHDMNSLGLIQKNETPITVVLLNNNGGGIFSFLPLAVSKKVKDKFFETPQDSQFQYATAQFDLDYVQPQSLEEFIKAYEVAVESTTSTIIEVVTNKTDNVQIYNSIRRQLNSSL